MRKSADGLADFAEKIFAEKWPYRFGSYGNIIAGKRRSDCYGIRKAYSWDLGDHSVYIAAEDQNAATAYKRATVGGDISTMPDQRGIIVCKKNALGRIYHAGIYVGGGMVIDIYLEGRPARKDPITMHGWTLWFQDIYIDYTQTNPAVCPYAEPTQMYVPRNRFEGNDAFWFQWQLARIGYILKIDGIAGQITWAKLTYEIGQGQRAGKIQNGVAGKELREYLKGVPTR